WPGDRSATRRENVSVGVFRVGPGRKAGDDVKLLQKCAQCLWSVVACGELFDIGEDACEGGFDVCDGPVRVVRPLPLQTAAMLHEFFPVKLDNRVLRTDRLRIVCEAWHAGPRAEL